MNKTRRSELRALADRLENLKSELESILDDEDNSRDNMPESLQGSERYETSENASVNMGDAISSLEEAISSIEEAAE